MVSESRKRANQKYLKNNPLKKRYYDAKNTSRSFIKPNEGTKIAEAVAKNENYKDDLIKLRALIDERLKEL